MNLFIDTPQRAAERMERERASASSFWSESEPELAPRPGANLWEGAAGEDAPAGSAAEPDNAFTPERAAAEQPGAPAEPYSAADESYREEKRYDRRRARRRKLMGALRVLATLVLVPAAVLAVFCVSYALTCILNGASPDELAQLFAQLLVRLEGFVRDLLPAT